jgi:peptidoglycan hydrolase-like protein with peptidoglycan-binding domain
LRFLIVLCTVALLAARELAAQSPPATNKKPSTSKSAPAQHKPVSHKTAAGPASQSKKPTSTAKNVARRRTSKTSKSTKTVAAVRRPTQQQPTADRYREIQDALASRGYFSGTADGTWGPESVDALKRFQRDQSLTEDGKIGSLSLIALGLGPKRPPLSEAATDKPAQR